MGQVERVAIISYHTCPLAALGGKKTGGMNVYVRDLARELGKRGINADVFTHLSPECNDHAHDVTLGDNARVIHVALGPGNSEADHNHLYEQAPAFANGIIEFAAGEGLRYDVIHSHYWLSGLSALALRETWAAPILHMFHTLGRMKTRVAQSANEREEPVRVDVETQLMNEVDCIVAATYAERAQLMWLYKANMSHIKIIPPGVDTTHFRPYPIEEACKELGLDSPGHLLLYVGRIEPLKGLDTLIRAAALLYKQRHDIGLAIIGGDVETIADEHSEMARLKALCDELGLSEMVTFYGARDQECLPYYYSLADVLVMPSNYESFGMVALEAMASGTPVIASEVGGLAFLVQDGITGFQVPYLDPEELAGKINLLVENPALRAEMSEAAVRHAQTYDWSLIADKIVAAYEDLAG